MPPGATETKETLNPTPQALEAFFSLYRKYERNLNILVASGALDIVSGSFTAHLDAQGLIQRIDRKDTLYAK